MTANIKHVALILSIIWSIAITSQAQAYDVLTYVDSTGDGPSWAQSASSYILPNWSKAYTLYGYVQTNATTSRPGLQPNYLGAWKSIFWQPTINWYAFPHALMRETTDNSDTVINGQWYKLLWFSGNDMPVIKGNKFTVKRSNWSYDSYCVYDIRADQKDTDIGWLASGTPNWYTAVYMYWRYVTDFIPRSITHSCASTWKWYEVVNYIAWYTWNSTGTWFYQMYDQGYSISPVVNPPATPTTPVLNTNQYCYTGSTVTWHTYTPFSYSGGYLEASNQNIFSGWETVYWREPPSFFAGDNKKYYSLYSLLGYSGALETLAFNTGALTANQVAVGDNYTIAGFTYPTTWNRKELAISYDWETQLNTTTGLLNYVRVVANKPWLLRYWRMDNKVRDKYIEDDNYSEIIPDADGYARLPTSWNYTRRFQVVFDDAISPTIQRIEWGKYDEIRTEWQVCQSIDGRDIVGVPILGDSGVQAVITMQNLLPQILAQQKSASGSTYTQLFAGCPSTVNNVDLATFNFLTWGINFTIPLTSFKIDIKPFESAACPIKTAVVFYNMIKP